MCGDCKRRIDRASIDRCLRLGSPAHRARPRSARGVDLRLGHRAGRANAGERGLNVVLTPTYSGCPATEMIAAQATNTLATAGFTPINLTTTHAPAWTSDWISAEGRDKLRRYGIAPPGPVQQGQDIVLRYMPQGKQSAAARWTARAVAATTPSVCQPLAPPHAKLCGAAWPAKNRLSISNLFDVVFKPF